MNVHGKRNETNGMMKRSDRVKKRKPGDNRISTINLEE
jgi:hypothetical protein